MPRRDQFEKFIETRQMRAGMRPRNAAYLIASFWLFAVIAFGAIERIADPKTFKTIWLAFWWAIQTVTHRWLRRHRAHPAHRQANGGSPDAGWSFAALDRHATITSSFVARRQREAMASGDDPVQNQLTQISDQLTAMETELRELRAALGKGESRRRLRREPGYVSKISSGRLRPAPRPTAARSCCRARSG